MNDISTRLCKETGSSSSSPRGGMSVNASFAASTVALSTQLQQNEQISIKNQQISYLDSIGLTVLELIFNGGLQVESLDKRCIVQNLP